MKIKAGDRVKHIDTFNPGNVKLGDGAPPIFRPSK
jgi:hypothetical protein